MALMSASRIVPILLLGLLAFAALVHRLTGRKNQTFGGVIVQDVSTYEFYPNAKDCNHRGTPYVLLPNERFREVVATSTDVEHIDRFRPLIPRYVASQAKRQPLPCGVA